MVGIQQYQCTHNCAALWAARVFLNLSTTNNANKQSIIVWKLKLCHLTQIPNYFGVYQYINGRASVSNVMQWGVQGGTIDYSCT